MNSGTNDTAARFYLPKVFLATLVAVLSQFGCDSRNPHGPNGQAGASPIVAQKPLVPLTNMVLIKAGTFLRLKHPVTVSREYWLGKYEVTQAEYAGVAGKNPSHFPNHPNHPVEKISFFDAVAYCSALTQREREAGRLPSDFEYRLPSEAEWEYACRAGTTNLYSFGDSTKEADQYAWTAENAGATTHPVGEKRPNPWGLHDIHGNVWEWTQDWFAAHAAADLKDPTGPPQGKFKVFRGGGWNNDVEYARSANRFMMSPSNGIHFVGFRIALSPTKP